jgi:Sulfatase
VNTIDLLLYRLILPLPWMLGAGLLGYLPRRRIADALLFAVAALVADQAERGVGAQVLIFLAAPLYAATRRPRFSVFTGAALLGLLLAAVVLKKRYAGSPLTWQDVQFFFQQFSANVGVLASQPNLLLQAALVLLGLTAVVVLGWRLDRRAAAIPLARTTVAAVCALAFVLTGWGAWDVVRQAQQVQHGGALVVGVGNAPDNEDLADPLTRFVAAAFFRPVWQLPATDTAGFRRQVRAFQGSAAGGAQAADIVVFLQESQFNPLSIDGCPEALCRLPAFGADGQTRAHGPMRVHVFGGGTWLSEFAASTGVPHDVFGAGGSFAPFNIASGVRHSLARSLKAAGYRTAAVYPVVGGMMNARVAYAGYGFDHFYDAAELGLSGTFATPDASIHAAALRVLAAERKFGKPVFLFVLTIFNHGEHGIHMQGVPSELVRAAGVGIANRNEANNVADYVWRTRQFDQVLATTRLAVLRPERPAVLAWFGDHQPPFGNAQGLRGRIQPLAGARIPARYQTWYQVVSNVDHLPAQSDESPVDLVFLPGLLAQAAGAPLDDWLTANVVAREECRGLLDPCSVPGVAQAYLTYLWQDLKAFQLP